MIFVIKHKELSGVSMSGWRLPDGRIEQILADSTTKMIDEWPEQVLVMRSLFDRQEIEKNNSLTGGRVFEIARYS